MTIKTENDKTKYMFPIFITKLAAIVNSINKINLTPIEIPSLFMNLFHSTPSKYLYEVNENAVRSALIMNAAKIDHILFIILV